VKIDHQRNTRINDKTVEQLLKLVNDGFNLSITTEHQFDVLEEFNKRRRAFLDTLW
jgi:recombinational DNA repair ATPase RecF